MSIPKMMLGLIQEQRKAKRVKRFTNSELVGYLGLILLECNYVPAIWTAVQTGVTLPVSSLLFYVSALSCFMYNAVKERNTLYIICNAFGIVGNAILLTLAVLK